MTFAERFIPYFDREVATRAAKSVIDGAEIQFNVSADSDVPAETFTFIKADGKNKVVVGAAKSPQFTFTMTPGAAEEILADPAGEIGKIGVGILKLIVSQDPKKRVSMKIDAGFLTLFAKGYLGVITAGGTELAAFLASKGLVGMGAIKAALKKSKG